MKETEYVCDICKIPCKLIVNNHSVDLPEYCPYDTEHASWKLFKKQEE